MVIAQERLELASLVQEYQALKLRLGLVEFADQMAIAARLAVQAPAVSAALRSSFAVVLLDEYQDTSAAQATMLRGLFSGDDAERRARPPGDRGRRPAAGDLRLAGRRGEQHPDLRGELPSARTAGRRPTSP